MTLVAHVEVWRGPLHLDVDLRVRTGEVMALVGPNGAGKSTLLRVIAGLLPSGSGKVELDGRVLEAEEHVRLPPDQRDIGVLFQDHLLFPHLSAVENVAFGLRARGMSRRRATVRSAEWLERVGVGHMADARPAMLSGGQAQRVALARALAIEPSLLLLDEPLSALDVESRLIVRRQLRTHLDAFAGPCILVTHDPVEALTLADRLAVIEEGRLVQVDAVSEVARRPRSPWAARLVGLNLFRGYARDGDMRMEAGSVIATASSYTGEAFAVVHPRAVALHRERPSGSPRNVWQGPITGIDAQADHVRVHVGGRLQVVAEVTPAAVTELDLARSTEIWCSVKASEVDLYPA